MTLVRLENVNKYYSGELLIEDVNLQVQVGSRFGLIGRNGTGKTTLLEIIKGDKEPDQGFVERNRNISLGFLPQTLDWAQEGNVADYLWQAFSELVRLREQLEEITEEMGRRSGPEILERYARLQSEFEEGGGYECESRIRGIINGLGFSEEALARNLKSFSGGEKTRLALARLLLEKPDLLLLDEPTNHLDRNNREWLAAYLKEYSGALILVSHDRYFLDQVANGILEIDDYRLYFYPGNYSSYSQQRELKVKTWTREYEKQQEEIAALEDFVRRYKAGQRSKEARSREKRLERMEKIPPPPPPRKKINLRFPVNRMSGQEVLKTEKFGCSKEGRQLFKDVEAELSRGDRVAFLGPNGAGKTTFLKCLLGRGNYEGNVLWGHGVELGYFDQEGGFLPRQKSLFQVIADFGLTRKQEIMDHLGAFRFGGEEAEKEVKMLSGGELSRFNLALLVLQGANVLLLDEPTNHLDLDLQEWLEQAILSYPGTLVFTSHDRYFIERVATKIWYLNNGRFFSFKGSYQEFLDWEKRNEQSREKAKGSPIERKTKRKAPPRKEKPENIRLELEERITSLEEAIEEYNKQFSDPDFFQRDDAQEIMADYDGKKKELEKLIIKWEKTLDEL